MSFESLVSEGFRLKGNSSLCRKYVSILVNLDYLNLSFEGLMNIDGVLSGLAYRSFVAVIRDLQDLGVFFVHRVGDRKARRTASGLSGIASSILEQF